MNIKYKNKAKNRQSDFTGADLMAISGPKETPKPSNVPIIVDQYEQPISVPEVTQDETKSIEHQRDDYLRDLLGDWIEQTKKNIK